MSATHPLYSEFPAAIAEVVKELGLSPEEAFQALQYIAAPTLRPIVGVREFMESPYYMATVKPDGSHTIYPKVLTELEQMNSGEYEEVVLTGGIGCVPPETEFLSPQGWRRISSWGGEQVAQYDPSTGQASFVIPEYVVKPSDGFWRFKTKYGLDMVVSDEHRVLYRTSKGNLRVRTAKEVADLHAGSVKGFSGKFLTTFKAPPSKGVELTEAQLRLQVAVQADGHFPSHLSTSHVVLRLKKTRKKARLVRLLDQAEVAYNESHDLDGYSRITFDAPLKTKRYADWAWGCSQSQLEIIAQESVYWDGDQDCTFYTTSKSDADFMSYCYSATNRRAVVGEDTRGLCELLYVVRWSANIEISMQGVPKTDMGRVASSDGKKYCFSVPTGFFVARHNGKVFITGNSAKTTCALYSTAYQLYRLSCYEDPHHLFGLDPSSEIVFIFQSLNAKAAKAVDYQRFRAMIEKSPYFQEFFPFDKSLESELLFPKRIIVRPVSSLDTAAIGQNVFGGIIDEINFMALIENSKSSIDGGFYDQAKAIYDSISKRRRSRFGMGGALPGLLCMVSSARYPGQFTDVKVEEARKQIRETGKTTIYVYDKREWEIKPEANYTGKWFDIFVGDEARKPRILKAGERERFPEKDLQLIMQIPEEYRADFERDIMSALRDTAGVATIAKHPFIPDREKVAACVREGGVIFGRDRVDFVETKLEIFADFINPKQPRFVHCDLAISGDSAGFAVGHVERFITIDRGGGNMEILPQIYIDALLEVCPPKGGEIQLFKVREVIYALKSMGLNIHWASFDQYQSRDSMQLLKQQNYQVGYQSMDANTMPYDFLKNALYDGRVSMPRHDKCQMELLSLEKDVKKNKIDHPPGGSKDVADALAGVVFGLTMRRETWAAHGVSLGAIPPSIAQALAKKNTEKEVAKGVQVNVHMAPPSTGAVIHR